MQRIPKKRVGQSLILVLSLIMLLSFQNCGKGLETLSQSETIMSVQELPSLTETSPEDSVLMWNAPVPALTNQQTLELPLFVKIAKEAILVSLMCQVNENPSVDCSEGKFIVNNLADGDYILKAVLIDSKNQSTELTAPLRVDRTPPVITVAQKPSLTSGSASAQVTFNNLDNLSSTTETTNECSLNQAAWSACVSPHNMANLLSGNQELRIRAKDKAQNLSEAVVVLWAVDLSTPNLILSQKPDSLTSSKSASFAFSANQSGTALSEFECQIDGQAFSVCTSPQNLSNLTDGNHTFSIRAKSLTNTFSQPLSYGWTVDSISPAAPTLTAKPNDVSMSSTAIFSFSAIDTGSGISDYECSINTGNFAACTSGKTYTNLGPGTHVFMVRAKDRAGNVSSATTALWIIDVSLPVIQLTQSPPPSTLETTAIFVFTASDNRAVTSLQCSLDNAAFSNCTSPLNLQNLAPGNHSLRIRAQDQAGNTQTLTSNWTIMAPVSLDGAALYANRCSGCHGQLARSSVRGESAANITSALRNIGAMSSIVLTTEEISAIAKALAQ